MTLVHLISRSALTAPEPGSYRVEPAEAGDAAPFAQSEIGVSAVAARAFEQEVERGREGWTQCACRHAIAEQAIDAARWEGGG